MDLSLTDLLDDLDATQRTPIERLTEASSMADRIRRAADDLVDSAVRDARRAGHSWTEIGDVLGVTRQAARQRFALPVLSQLTRLTDRAQLVLDVARADALRHGRPIITPTDLLAALARPDAGVAAAVLLDLLNPEDLTALPANDAPTKSVEPWAGYFSPSVWELLTVLAPRQAGRLGHGYVGVDHLLLAIAAQRRGAFRVLLDKLTVAPDELERRTIDAMLTRGSALTAGS